MRLKSTTFLNPLSKAITTINGLTVIKDVVIVQSGVDKVGDLMDDDFITELVTQGNLFATGVKCRGGHPNMCQDSLGTYIGDYKNFRTINDNGQLKAIADLHIADIATKTQINGQGITYHDYIVEMATNNPDKLGNSIVFQASSEMVEKDGQQYNKLTLLPKGFIASDIVDSPAATDGLFKNDDDLGIKLSLFLDDNPQVFEALEKNDNAITIFIKKYLQNSKTKNMSWLKKLKKSLSSKSIDMTDASGAVLTIETDAEQPAVGDAVTIGSQPAADGEYVMADGSTIVVVAGVISEIKPTTETASTEEVAKAIDIVKHAFDEKLKAIQTKYDTEVKELRESVEFLGAQIKSGYVPPKEDAIEAGKKKDNKSKNTINVQKLREKNQN